MAWIPLVVNPDTPAFALQLNALQGNFTALAEGQAGAPKILSAAFDVASLDGDRIALATMDGNRLIAGSVGETEIGIDAVHTGEISTSVATNNFSMPSPSFGLIHDRQTMSGGQHAFQPRTANIGPDSGDSEHLIFCYGADNNGVYGLGQYIAFVNLNLTANAGWDGQALSRYIDSSAPWDMGDGEIPLFVFLRVKGNPMQVTASTIATAPCWGYNGNTSVIPDRVDKVSIDPENPDLTRVRKWKNIIDPDQEANIILPPWKGGDPAQWNVDALDNYLEFCSNPPLIEVEIDHAMKNADMEGFPHPFSTLGDDETVVLLEPCCPIVEHLAALHEQGEDIHQLFKQGYLELTDPVSNCVKPPGVEVYGVQWKVTA